ncbi:MAG: sensor histidine kinase, partial [Candidatus Latescibacterota bacterium]
KDLMVLANRDLLNIIFSNLISNALKYSMPGTTITINASGENGKVHILVKDQGIGIGPEDLLSIFDEFYRTRKAREMEKDGTGLGLPIVKKAIERLKGEISVYSEEGNGTTFHVYLPRYYEESN